MSTTDAIDAKKVRKNAFKKYFVLHLADSKEKRTQIFIPIQKNTQKTIHPTKKSLVLLNLVADCSTLPSRKIYSLFGISVFTTIHSVCAHCTTYAKHSDYSMLGWACELMIFVGFVSCS